MRNPDERPDTAKNLEEQQRDSWSQAESSFATRLARVSAADLRRMYAASTESRETFLQTRG